MVFSAAVLAATMMNGAAGAAFAATRAMISLLGCIRGYLIRDVDGVTSPLGMHSGTDAVAIGRRSVASNAAATEDEIADLVSFCRFLAGMRCQPDEWGAVASPRQP
jgi:hypothetical protein